MTTIKEYQLQKAKVKTILDTVNFLFEADEQDVEDYLEDNTHPDY